MTTPHRIIIKVDPAGHEDQLDLYVTLTPFDGIELSLSDGGEAWSLSFDEAVSLRKALKTLLKEWTRQGVI